jgi:hypothetical protein
MEKEKIKNPAPEEIPDLEKISRQEIVEGLPVDDESMMPGKPDPLKPKEPVKTFG